MYQGKGWKMVQFSEKKDKKHVLKHTKARK